MWLVKALGRVLHCRKSVQATAVSDTPTEHLKMASAVGSNRDSDRPENYSI